MIFHQPSARAELEEIMTTRRAHPRQKSFLYLVLVILAIGTRYALKSHEIRKQCEDVNLASLQADLMKQIEQNLFTITDRNDIGSVQTCVLLGSLYLYHRRPRRGVVVNGIALKLAHALRLHKESAWGSLEILEREIRRRVWWALYVCEAYLPPSLNVK